MAKPLILQHGDGRLSYELIKVDRSKLYGFKEMEVLDEHEQPCELATLASDGKTVVGRGGTAVGYLDPDGLWRDRAELTPVDLEGQEIQPVGSSFDAPIPLDRTVTVDQFLDYDIRLVYAMRGDDLPEDLAAQLRQGIIFPFSFRGGVEADPAFLLMNHDNELFMLVGKETTITLVGLQQSSTVMEDEESAEADSDSDELDFSMI
jgi:hypothetical protein